MTIPPVIWLASYPRSGNTFLRTIIFSCFGVRTGSIYPNDLGEGGLADVVGHIEHSPDRSIPFRDEPVWLIKTHHPPRDDGQTIYVIRDGRAATTSMYAFSKGRRPLTDIIEGRNGFGTWSAHMDRWRPLERPGTLFLRYEELVENPRMVVEQLAEHLKLVPRSYEIPSREAMASRDGKWIRAAGSEHARFSPEEEARFWEINGEAMRRYGYA